VFQQQQVSWEDGRPSFHGKLRNCQQTILQSTNKMNIRWRHMGHLP
jgi:hypothetical protein